MLKLLAASAAFAALLGYILFLSPLFKLKSTTISDVNKCVSSTDLASDLQIAGKNIFFLSEANLENSLKSKYTCVEKVTVKKQFPSTIKVDVVTREPLAQIEGTDLLIREDGFVTSAQKTKDLPKLFLPERIKPEAGQKITDELSLFALKVTNLLLKSDYFPTSVRVLAAPDIAVYDPEGVVVMFSQKRSADDQVDSLQSVLAKAKIDATQIAKIDLRFEKPVIQNKPK